MALVDDVIAVWEMEEPTATDNAMDEVASNDLICNGSIESATGKIVNARVFVATEYFDISSGLVTSLPMSASIWFNSSVANASQNLMGGGINASDNFAWGLYITAGNKLSFYSADGAASFDEIIGSTTLTRDGSTWYHALIVWRSATDRELYLNGVSEGTSSVSRTVSGSADRFKLASYAPVVDATYTGMMDQAALWGRDLTSGDISELYNSGNGLAYSSWTAGGGGPIIHELGPDGVSGASRWTLKPA